MGRQLWSVYKALGPEAFKEALRYPTAISWVGQQITKDREDLSDLIIGVFEMAQPWLNHELYVAIEKKKKEQENKVARIARTDDPNKVEVVSLFDSVMKNAGVDISKLKEK